MRWLETAAFAWLIGAQFLAVIYLTNVRHALYPSKPGPQQPEVARAPAHLDSTEPSIRMA